jgi:hypothetical protein
MTSRLRSSASRPARPVVGRHSLAPVVRADWLNDARRLHPLPAGGDADLAKVDEFDVEALAGQLGRAGPHLVLTLGQNPATSTPNAAYDRETGYAGERCPGAISRPSTAPSSRGASG